MPRHSFANGRSKRNRHLAELMVAGDLLSRREAKAALRLARRDNRRLVDVLLHSGRINTFHLLPLRRLEMLGHDERAGSVAVDLSFARGLPYPGRPAQSGRLATAAVGAAMMLGGLGVSHKLSSKSQSAPPRAAQALRQQPATDLRFASLDNVEAELSRLHRRRRLNRPLPESLRIDERRRASLYRAMVEQYAGKHGISPALVLAIIEQESRFDPHAQSHANAIGLMQIVPESGGRAAYRHLRYARELPSAEELRHPETNIRIGTLYLRLLLDEYFPDVQGRELRTDVALAAYNWGPGNVREMLDQQGMPASAADFQSQLGRQAPIETRRYVKAVRRRMIAYS